ncbi:MAG: thiamine diphosphokinase [Spirochaetales bacterium]|nr:thiamine diphosphokinase [Spirochaetales bacterium]
MKAAIWTGGEAPDQQLTHEILGQRGFDQIAFHIAADSGAQNAQAWGITLDAWIGDGDSLRRPLDLEPSKLTLLPRDKDLSDTEAAVRLALQRGAESLILLGGGGGRMDHWLANLSLVRQTPQITTWITAHERIDLLAAPQNLVVGPGTLSVFCVEQTGSIVSSGLQWPLDAVDFSQWYSLSNRVEGEATLTVTKGRFMIMTREKELPQSQVVP